MNNVIELLNNVIAETDKIIENPLRSMNIVIDPKSCLMPDYPSFDEINGYVNEKMAYRNDLTAARDILEQY